MFEIKKVASLGVVHPALFPQVLSGEGPILETARMIVEDPFFDCIEISWVKDEKEREKLAHLLKMGQMKVVFTQGAVVYAKGLNLHSLDPEKRKNSVEETKRLIDEAKFLNARIFQIIGGPDPGTSKREEAKKFFEESLCELCEYAGEEMVISLENLDREVHKKFLIGPTPEAVELIKRVKKFFPNIGLSLDLAHLPLLGESLEEAVEIAREHIVHVHLGNCILRDPSHPRYGDKHPPMGIPEGEIGTPQLVRFLKKLIEIGFLSPDKKEKPVISFEILSQPEESPKVLLAASKRIFTQALLQIE